MSFPPSTDDNVNRAQIHPPPKRENIRTTAEHKTFVDLAPKHWNEHDAKEAMLNECKTHPTWNKAAVDKMVVLKVENYYVFYYAIESFYESRATRWTVEPYNNHNNSHRGMWVSTGVVAQPWEVPCQPTQLFRDETKTSELPNTVKIGICSACEGVMGKQCFSCNGNGYKDCPNCAGTGSHSKEGSDRPIYTSVKAPPAKMQPIYMRTLVMGTDQCGLCRGTGAEKCFSCKGIGWDCCVQCKGSGHSKSKVQRSEMLTDCGEIPTDKIKKAGGTQKFLEQKQLITAIGNHSSVAINSASLQFLTEQNAKADRLILQQRQVVTAIPIATVTYTMSGSDTRVFHMYGEEKNVFVRENPPKVAEPNRHVPLQSSASSPVCTVM